MNCPYCGYDSFNEVRVSTERHYECRRCKYQFPVSVLAKVFDKIISIPLASLIYTPIIFVVNYYFAKVSYISAMLSFTAYLIFTLILSICVIMFLYFTSNESKTTIFIIKKSRGFWRDILAISPLLKICFLLFLSLFFVPLL